MHTKSRHPSRLLARTDRGRATLFLTSALSALIGGTAIGAVIGPPGIAWGLLFGLGLGLLAGKVLTQEEDVRAERTRELDAIIGATSPSLGASGSNTGALRDYELVGADRSALEPASTQGSADTEGWLAEWLTPPPPKVC